MLGKGQLGEFRAVLNLRDLFTLRIFFFKLTLHRTPGCIRHEQRFLNLLAIHPFNTFANANITSDGGEARDVFFHNHSFTYKDQLRFIEDSSYKGAHDVLALKSL